jgi:hypothetical protein
VDHFHGGGIKCRGFDPIAALRGKNRKRVLAVPYGRRAGLQRTREAAAAIDIVRVAAVDIILAADKAR